MKKYVTIEVGVIVDTNDFAGAKLSAKDIARKLNISPVPKMSEELFLEYINHGDDNDVLSLLFGGKKQSAKITKID